MYWAIVERRLLPRMFEEFPNYRQKNGVGVVSYLSSGPKTLFFDAYKMISDTCCLMYWAIVGRLMLPRMFEEYLINYRQTPMDDVS